MLFVLKILPLCLHGRIALHVDMGLTPFEVVLLVDGYEVVEKQGVGTFRAILRQHAYKQAVYNVGLLQIKGAEEMPPTKGQQTALAAFLQRTGQRRDADAYTHDFVVGRIPVFYDAEHVHGEKLEVLMYILVYLSLCHLRVAVKVTESLIHHGSD